LAEKALLDTKSLASVNLGLRTLEFNRHYLLILLGRSSGKLEPETITHAKEMLYLLKQLVSDSEEVYNGIVWQLVCCPFTPFLVLFGQILDNRSSSRRDNVESLAAMRELPVFLEAMGRRNTLASKLHMIAEVFVDHAESMVNPPTPKGMLLWLVPPLHKNHFADCTLFQARTLYHLQWQPNILLGQDSPNNQLKASPAPLSMLPGLLSWITLPVLPSRITLYSESMVGIAYLQETQEAKTLGLTCSSATPTLIG